MTPLKICGLLLIAIGIPFGRTALDDLLPVSYWLATGLCMIFFGPERINDERVLQLKMKALFTAMSAGLGLTFLGYILLATALPDLGSPAVFLRKGISAWDFLAGVMALSLALFYFYRWQDARPAGETKVAVAPAYDAGGRKFYRAPWSSELKLLSGLFTVLLLGVALILARRSDTLGWWPLAGLVALVVAPIFFVIRGYAVVGETLLVRRLFGSTQVSLAGLISATVEPEAMRDSTRTFGNGGAFSYSGFFHSARLGKFRAYVTDPARVVVLRWADRAVAISPAAPEAFIRELPVGK